MAEIGNLSVQIGADTSGLERGVRRGRRELNELGGGMERVTGIAQRLTGILAAVGAGIGFANAIREIANFQTAMNGLAAVSGATEQQMATLEKQARTLGATSRFSAQQAAEGQRFLAQAGFEVNETLAATPGILQLATAAQLDLGTAADIASNVLGGMRLEVDQLNRVNDVLAATASRSNTTIQQLGQALSFAAPFAASAGISIEEAAAAIGNMSDAGIQASRAGTGLVGTIRQLSKVTDSGADVLERHGLSLGDVNIEARGLGPVLETLRQANLNTAEAIELFGSEAGAAAQVLVNDYGGAITDATGEAERMADQLEQGLEPAFKSLQSAISESVLQMGDSGLAGALEGLIRNATGVISVFNGMEKEWAESNDVAQDHLETIEASAAAIQGLTGALVGAGGGIAAMALLTKGTGSARAAMVGLNIAMRANPIGALITVASTAAGVIFTFREELGLVAEKAGLASEEIDALTEESRDLSDEARENSIGDLSRALEEATLKAAAAREELAMLRSENRGSGFLGFEAGAVGEEIRGMQAVADAQEKILEINQRMQAVRDGGMPRFGPLSDFLFDVDPSGGGGGGDGRPGEGDEGSEDQDPAQRFQGGIGIFGEEENQAFIEMLRARLEARQAVLNEFDVLDTERQQEKFEADMERLKEALNLRAITEEEYQKAALERERKFAADKFNIRQDSESGITGLVDRFNNQQVSSYASAFDSILSSLATYSKTAFKIQKALAIANAVVKGYEAVVGAYAWGANIGGPPLGAAMAAAAGAATFAQISNIRAQSFNGGGGGGSISSGGGGGGGAASTGGGAQAQQTQQQEQNTIVTIQGLEGDTLLSSKQVRGLIEQINEATENGAKIRIAN